MSNYRNRALLDTAYEIACTAQLPGCQHMPCVPAHSNQSRHGKGTSIKAHDHWIAACCDRCHYEIDQGSTLSREERIACWDSAHIRTMDALWKGGYLTVKGAK